MPLRITRLIPKENDRGKGNEQNQAAVQKFWGVWR